MRYFLMLVLLAPSLSPAFVAKDATEAQLTFSHFVEIESSAKPTVTEAKAQVEKQLAHLFGPLERARTMAVPKEDHQFEVTDRRPDEDQPGIWRIEFDYLNGTFVVEKSRSKELTLILPKNPDLIFQQSLVGSKSPCTDPHYQSEGDFWYFWSPKSQDYPDCQLKSGVHYDTVKALIKRQPNSEQTLPEYNRLVDSANTITFHLFYGLDNPVHSHNPYVSRGNGARAYQRTARDLTDMGFVIRPWSEAEMRAVAYRIPHITEKIMVEEATRTIGKYTLKIRLFFGETGIDEDSRPFHYFFADALVNSRVLTYNGHSGLGGHLNLESIANSIGQTKLKVDRDNYQIFFFNGCTSYTYFNTLYFNHKRGNRRADSKGTKNLDILANGLSTAYDTKVNADMVLIEATAAWAESGKETSYKKLADKIDSENLFTVNGDEDNPKVR